MKKICIVLLVALILCFYCVGCSTKKVIEESNDKLEEYFAHYDDSDIQAMISMYHDSLVEDVGGEEFLANRLNARRKLLGRVKSIKVINTGFETVNSDSEVFLSCYVEYENGETAEEKYTFLTIDDGLYITAISIPGEKAIDDLITAYTDAIFNTEEMMQNYIPFAVDSVDVSYVEGLAVVMRELGGEYNGYTIVSREYLNAVMGYYTGILAIQLEQDFENMKFLTELQYSEQDGEIGLNYEQTYPYPVYEIVDEYILCVRNGALDNALKLYADEFYQFVGTDKEGWKQSFLVPITSDYGNYVDYSINSFEYSIEDIMGEQKEVLTAYIRTDYEDASFNERISFLFEDRYEIVGHYAEILE